MRATSALAAARPVKPKSAATSDTTSMMSAHFSNDMGRILSPDQPAGRNLVPIRVRLVAKRAALPAALIAVLRRSDVGRDGARRGADHRAWIALRPHGGQEGRIHAAVGAARNRHGRDAAVD